jgi:hypothetical protein
MSNKFLELRKLDVGSHIEKKNNLSYLSWAWAVDVLLQNDPNATWEFPEPKQYGETMMVFCDVSAFGKTMKMHLPVMDNRNQAVKNPDSVQINKAMMRCLAKCIATFGIGLYIFSGEDLPSDVIDVVDTEPYRIQIQEAQTLDDLHSRWKIAYKAFTNNPSKQLELEKEKDKRKTELLAIKPADTTEQEQA